MIRKYSHLCICAQSEKQIHPIDYCLAACLRDNTMSVSNITTSNILRKENKSPNVKIVQKMPV